MQHMPDKEFDNLFRDRFKDAEITPSANLWANIEQQLVPQRKRSFPIYWVAAATIAVAFTAMLAFQKTEKIQLRLDQATAKVTAPSANETADMLETGSSEHTLAVNDATVSHTRFAAAQASHRSLKAVAAVQLTADSSKNIQLAVQPNVNDVRLAIKQADVRPLDVLTRKEEVVENPIVLSSVVAKPNIENVITETESSTERKGIRNIGDIVNYVVEKVDKREKKFLKFNTDDDDNSSIIGINIGFIKLNSKKHK